MNNVNNMMAKELRGYRKAGKMGNSIGIVIPKDIVEALGISAGDEFEVKANPQDKVITITPIKKVPMGGVSNEEIKEMLKDVFARYDNTFKNLKNR